MANITVSGTATNGFSMESWGAHTIISIVASVFASRVGNMVRYTANTETLILTGNFTSFDANGDPNGGTLTGVEYTIFEGSGATTFGITGLNLSMATVYGWLLNNNQDAIMKAEGLTRYGFVALATEIRQRWLSTVDDVFRETGRLFEKYDVVRKKPGGGGEYEVQDGFGWTNGVTKAFGEAMAAANEATDRVEASIADAGAMRV